MIRFYFQNVNGLRLADDGSDILDAFHQMETIGADVFGFAETKLDCRNQSIGSLIHRQKKKIWAHCKVVSSSSILPWHSTSKPGGVMLGITGPMVGRIRNTLDDDLGRWTGLDLLGRDGRNLLIICAYQVPQRGGSAGAFTAYTQQASLLRLKGVNNPNPRRQFVRDLTTLLRPYVQSKSDIILMGDFNESIGLNTDGMAHLIQECRLTDVQAFRHGLETEQSTYARGPNRVDYFLLSDRLLQYVLRQGCEAFSTRIFSDHRGLFMDVSYPGFFDRAPNVLAPPSRRNLIFDCPRHVRLYLGFMDQYMGDHNLIDRANQMADDARDDEFAEAFDKDFTAGLLAADRRCKSFHRSPWSQELHVAMTTRHIYQRQLSSLITGHDMTTVIDRLQEKLPESIPLSRSRSETQKQLRNAQQTCRQVVRQARDLAKTHQETRIIAKQLANPESDPETMAKIIRHRDASREMWRRIPSSKPKNAGGISMLKIPQDSKADPKDPTTVFRSVVDPQEMEDLLVARNRAHFKQASGTPLADPKVSQALGWGGDSLTAESLLKGELDTSEVTADRYAQAILAECRRLNDEIDPTITLEQFQQAYLKWRVGTSTSPSGRHLSHLHALFQPVGQANDPPERSKFYRDVKDLLWFMHHACVHYATRYGYCFDRWRQVVTTMIEKEPGNPAIHRLRVIHLYENDYNLLLGTKYRQVMHQCQDNSQLNAGCYGGLSNKQSVDPVFLELMQYDYSLLTRWDTIKFANDAGSCYDRIVVSPSNVMARSRGLHTNIAKIHGSMLEHAVYRIKTQLGISDQGYSHSAASPVYGTGQGSKSSPPTWNINGSLYFDVYDKYCHGANYVDLESILQLRIGMAGFVDDNSVQVTCHPAHRASIIRKATEDAQLWSDILWASGGVLEHAKCSYHYLRTDFDMNGAPILRSGTHGDPIIIRDASGNPTALTQLSVYTPYKTLGTFQCPGSAQRQQMDTLVQKAQLLVRTLATSACRGQAAWLYYSSVFCKSVGYPLAVSRMSTKQIGKIQGPMTPVILNRLGYERRLSHALAFGPRSFGGLGLTHLKTVQASSQIKLMLRHLRNPGQPGTLAKINLNRLQYTAGVSFPIFEQPKTHLPHLEGTWLPHFRELLSELNASLRVADVRIAPMQRENDEYIMDRVLSSSSFSDRETRLINYCRLYLQCICISDISTACGTKLMIGVEKGDITRFQSVSVLQEPFQELPGYLAWRAWRKMLRLFSTKDGLLRTPLGQWLAPASGLRRRWPFLYSPGLQKLYEWRTSGYACLEAVRPRIFRFTGTELVTEVPEDCSPIEIDVIQDGYRTQSPGTIASSHDIPTLMSLSFREYLDYQKDYERCALLRFDLFGRDIHDALEDIRTLDEVLLVSDASVEHKCGSFGWIICLANGHRIAQGSGLVFGDDPSSYRAEISGSRAGLLFLCHAFVYCERDIPNGCLQIFCDNIGYVNKTASMQDHSLAPLACCLDSDWDLLISVNQLLSLFPTQPKVTHIRGHQDRHSDYETLSLPSQLNVDADALAKVEMDNFGRRLPEVPFDPISCALIAINGRTITGDIETAVRHQQLLPSLQTYLCNRFNWTDETFDSIDWASHAMVYEKYHRSRKFFVQFGWKKLPCGRRLHARESRFDDRCPCCLAPDETDDHLVQCEHIDRKHWRSSFLHGIRKKLSQFLDPELLDMIILGLSGYFRNSPGEVRARFPDPHHIPSDDLGSFRSEEVEEQSSSESSITSGGSGGQQARSLQSSFTDSIFSTAEFTDEEDGNYNPDDSESWDDTDSPPISNDPYILLRQAQDTIGWDHFLRGKWSTKWNDVQYRFAVRNNLLDQSRHWQKWLIQYMAVQTYNLWCLRNKQRHGSDQRAQHQAQLEQARRDVTALYSFQDRVLVQDRVLFGPSLDEHLNQPLSYLKNWLVINKALILHSARTAKAQSKLQTHPIQRFFKPTGRIRISAVTTRKRRSHQDSRPSRLTEFFTKVTRVISKIPSARRDPQREGLAHQRPRQRYLFDFFPNHPG